MLHKGSGGDAGVDADHIIEISCFHTFPFSSVKLEQPGSSYIPGI